MPNHANIHLIGHLGQDAKVSAQGDRCVINFAVAHTRKRKDVETTTWWNVAYWCKVDRISQYLKKGKPVLVSGEPYERQYKRKDGTDGSQMQIDASDVVLLGGREDAADAPAAPAAPAPAKAAADAQDGPPF